MTPEDPYYASGRPAIASIPSPRLVGASRPKPRWRRYSPDELRRRRALALAREQIDAARDAGDEDVARAFEHVLEALEPQGEAA